MKNSEPEKEEKLCRLDAKQKLRAITPRLIREASPTLPSTAWGLVWDLKNRDPSYRNFIGQDPRLHCNNLNIMRN